MIPGIIAAAARRVINEASDLPSILALGTPVAEYTVPGMSAVRGIDISPDGSKATLYGFTSNGVRTFHLDSVGSMQALAAASPVWSSSKVVLACRFYGDGSRALVVLSNTWEVVRWRVSKPYVFSGPSWEASTVSLAGITSGSMFLCRDGLRAYMYGGTDALATVTQVSMGTPGDVHGAAQDYTVDLAELTGFSAADGDRFNGIYVSEDGRRIWLAIGKYSSNSRGRLVDLLLATPFDLRTAGFVRSVGQPAGKYINGHPIGYNPVRRRLLLGHQAESKIGEYEPDCV